VRPATRRRTPLDGFVAALSGADAHGFLYPRDENLAIADTAGLRRTADRLDSLLGLGVLDDQLDLHFGQEVDDVLGTAIELGMALLPPEALGLDHRDALHADLVERFLHFVELERLDDGFDLFHRHATQVTDEGTGWPHRRTHLGAVSMPAPCAPMASAMSRS
jgi:hypothetical protein